MEHSLRSAEFAASYLLCAVLQFKPDFPIGSENFSSLKKYLPSKPACEEDAAAGRFPHQIFVLGATKTMFRRRPEQGFGRTMSCQLRANLSICFVPSHLP